MIIISQLSCVMLKIENDEIKVIILMNQHFQVFIQVVSL